MLEQVHTDLWLADGKTVSFYGVPYPTRTAVARLGNGDLWVWSPIALSHALQAELQRIGPVRHLVSPNKLHHLYLSDWKAAYPEAFVWGPASTARKRPDLAFHGVLNDRPPPEWAHDIDQAWFRGSFALDEIVFCHWPSRTAIVADLIQTFSADFLRNSWGAWRFLAQWSGLTERDGLAPIDWRLSFLNRAPARAARDKVLGWNCQSVIVAHGEWTRCGGHERLVKSFAWLGRS
ncbi:MAG TPA: DUF4336 domain-containing protein [Steroidobacteraceae bacterium]|jgi:hypothetical protein